MVIDIDMADIPNVNRAEPRKVLIRTFPQMR